MDLTNEVSRPISIGPRTRGSKVEPDRLRFSSEWVFQIAERGLPCGSYRISSNWLSR